MDDFEIELLDEQESSGDELQLPVNFITVGTVEPDDIKVYIRQDVYKALEKYSLEDTAHERGTMILGEYSKALGKTHVVISEYIEAKYTDASASTLTFTHETWDYVHETQDRLYPDKKIVGWQHTHPGYGIFLSNYDIFIHENFFDLPFQVAYVIDPVQDLRGFFQWKDGKIIKLGGFYIYDDPGKPIKIAKSKTAAPSARTSEAAPSAKFPGAAKAVIAILSVLTVISLVCTVILFSRLENQSLSQRELSQRVDDQSGAIAEYGDILDDVGGNEDVLRRIDELETTIADQNKTIDDLRNNLQQEENTSGENTDSTQPSEPAPTEPETDPGNGTLFRCVTHTVSSGETLTDICRSYNISWEEYSGIILSLNGINDPDLIYEGQKLLIPVG